MTVFLAAVLVVLLACVEIYHSANRPAAVTGVSTPQRVRRPDLLADLPEFCELCRRPMVWPVGTARKSTRYGRETIYVCACCLDDPVMSVMTAGASPASRA